MLMWTGYWFDLVRAATVLLHMNYICILEFASASDNIGVFVLLIPFNCYFIGNASALERESVFGMVFSQWALHFSSLLPNCEFLIEKSISIGMLIYRITVPLTDVSISNLVNVSIAQVLIHDGDILLYT